MSNQRVTRGQCKEWRQAIAAELDDFAALQGVTITLGNGSFNEKSYSVKVTVDIATSSEEIEQREFEKWCGLYRVPADKFNALFTHRGVSYELRGFKPSSPKFCVIGRATTGPSVGKNMLFTEQAIGHIRQPKTPVTVTPYTS